jgi:hypothetical protein
MSFSEFELKKYQKELNSFIDEIRPPVHIRKELDYGYRIDKQSILLFETRPDWIDLDQVIETYFAKATYVRTQKIWKIYWLRQDLKFHKYEPVPQVKHLSDFIKTVKEDEFCCFFG